MSECLWKKVEAGELYETGCDEMQMFLAGGIEYNSYNYCPYCGGIIVVIGDE